MIEFREALEGDQKVIFLDDEMFDWGLDEDSAQMANESIKNDEDARSVHLSVMEFFLESLEAVTGERMNIDQVNKALETGSWEMEEIEDSGLSGWASFLNRGLYNLDKLKRFEICPRST